MTDSRYRPCGHFLLASAMGVLFGPLLQGQRGIPPVHPIGAVVAQARDSIGLVTQLLALRDGRVVINDPRRQRLVILDSALGHPLVVADRSSETNKAYGELAGTVLAYRADTILYVDPTAQAVLVIDPAGKIARVMALPRPGDAMLFVGLSASVNAAMDPLGRIVYALPGSALCGDPTAQDSSMLIRADIVTRAVDTLGYLRRDKSPCPTVDANGVATPRVQPFQRRDAWALLSDGTVAFVRAQDFTFGWIDPTGAHRSTPRIPHDWQRLTDSDKVVLVDSLRVYLQANPISRNVRAPDGAMHPQIVVPTLPDPASLPDYRPAFTFGGIRADADANLWIPETPNASILPPKPGLAQAPSRQIYDVVNRLGALIDRVQVPGGTTIVGFGPGVAYLTSREGGGTSLVRVRIR